MITIIDKRLTCGHCGQMIQGVVYSEFYLTHFYLGKARKLGDYHTECRDELLGVVKNV